MNKFDKLTTNYIDILAKLKNSYKMLVRYTSNSLFYQ